MKNQRAKSHPIINPQLISTQFTVKPQVSKEAETTVTVSTTGSSGSSVTSGTTNTNAPGDTITIDNPDEETLRAFRDIEAEQGTYNPYLYENNVDPFFSGPTDITGLPTFSDGDPVGGIILDISIEDSYNKIHYELLE